MSSFPDAQASRPAPPPRRRKSQRRRVIVMLVAIVILGFGLRWLGSTAGLDVPDGSTLRIKIEGSYVEAPAPGLVARMMGGSNQTFVSLLSLFSLAERDDRIDDVVIHIRRVDLGWGKAEEVRGAITRLRDAGKRTVAYLEVEGFRVNREIYIASAADEIYVVPGSATPFVGLSAEYIHLGGVWEKLDVEVEYSRVGKYKSAVESIADEGMSEASREMANSLLDETERHFVNAVAQGRKLSVEQVHAVINEGPVLASQLKDAGLIDGVLHLDDVEGLERPYIEGKEYRGIDPKSLGFAPEVKVALIYGSGTVITGDANRTPSGAPVFSSGPTREAILEAAKDPEIEAILLRIDSPGGSPMASDVIWNAIELAKQEGKPIIASFSDVAASGAYYVGSAADAIVAPRGVLTGSIGVYVLRPVLGGLLERVGVSIEPLRRGDHADFLSSTQPLSDASRERLDAATLQIYNLFIKRVSEGRGLEVQQVDAVAQGRVWSGDQALAAHLIDEIGGLHEAVARVLRELELDEQTDVLLVPYPAPRSFAEEVAQMLQGRAEVSTFVQEAVRSAIPLPEPIAKLHEWLSLLPSESPLLISPLLIDIH